MRKSKYGNKRTDGYASAKEAKRASELKLLEKAGEIQNLREQVKFEVIPKLPGERASYYIADFVYRSSGKTIIEDVKGVRTPIYILKRKLMLFRYGVTIVEI